MAQYSQGYEEGQASTREYTPDNTRHHLRRSPCPAEILRQIMKFSLWPMTRPDSLSEQTFKLVCPRSCCLVPPGDQI
ncbi:MAG TPA: hypothetical protein DD438_05445 [Verrucomicrobiales bacterium]|nr:hypothetical protein [Verrucomicrobiales bacterium]